MNTIRLIEAWREHMLCVAADRRAAAYRYRDVGDIERAEMALDEAGDALAKANALRDLLAERDDVQVNDPRQLALMNIGEEA